jgi:hypothetical protein
MDASDDLDVATDVATSSHRVGDTGGRNAMPELSNLTDGAEDTLLPAFPVAQEAVDNTAACSPLPAHSLVAVIAATTA